MTIPSIPSPADLNVVAFACNHLVFRQLMQKRRHRAIGVLSGAVRCSAHSLPVDGMTMDAGPHRIELPRFSGISAGFLGWPDKVAIKFFRLGFVWLPVVLVLGFGAWTVLSGYLSDTAESEPVSLATVAAEPAPSPAANFTQADSWSNPAATPVEGTVPATAAPVDGLKISSQSWRRGGLGSKALVTFTLRNANDYAVRDIEIFCAFTRRDGSHLTDRKRMIRDTVNMKSRRTFARMHIGFVNINANQAKCSLVAANRI